MCDRIAIMDHGRLVATGTLPELLRLLPGTRGVRIELASPPGPFFFAGVEVQGKTLLLESSQPSDDLPKLLVELQARGLALETIHSFQPTLEQVFLHLTGRSLRD